MNNLRVFIIIAVLLASCSEKETEFQSIKDLQAYTNDPENGFIKSETTAKLKFEAKITPSIAGEKKPRFTIQLRISRKDGGQILEYGNVSQDEISYREGYLSFDLLDDVSVRINGKRKKALFHHYERNYGLKPSIDVLFEFQHIRPNDDVEFLYRDQLFGEGLVKLKFDKELFTKCYVAKK